MYINQYMSQRWWRNRNAETVKSMQTRTCVSYFSVPRYHSQKRSQNPPGDSETISTLDAKILLKMLPILCAKSFSRQLAQHAEWVIRYSRTAERHQPCASLPSTWCEVATGMWCYFGVPLHVFWWLDSPVNLIFTARKSLSTTSMWE